MFHNGQKIIRVTEWCQTNASWRGRPINKNEVHIVREYHRYSDGSSAMYLEGIHNPPDIYGKENGYDPTQFAPYNPPAEYIAVTFSKLPEPCAS